MVLQGSRIESESESTYVTLVHMDHIVKKEQADNMAVQVELLAFMKNMQIAVDKISKDITESKTELKNDFNEGRIKMKKELLEMNNKIANVQETVDKNRSDGDKRMNQMEARMETFEDEMKKQESRVNFRKNIMTETQKTDRDLVEEIVPLKKTNDTTEKPRASYVDKTKNIKAVNVKATSETGIPEAPQYKSTWAMQYSQANLEEQLVAATEAAARLESQNIKKVKRPIIHKTKPKMGDSIELHTQQDWDWNQGNEEWDGTIDRQEKNLEKKKRDMEKKAIKVKKAINVAKCTLGIGPIANQSIEYFHNITADYGEAKKMATTEFLTEYLKYDSEDLQELNITDTKISAKGDSIVYVVMDSPGKIRNLRRRISDIQNEVIKTREYIPPHFFSRYSALSKHAQEMRSENNSIKMQIRFEDDDIELFTKLRGSDEPFQPAGINAPETKIELPPIDYNAKWKRKEDRPPWRNVSPQRERVVLKSLAGKPSFQKNKHRSPMNEPVSKKSKHQLNADSSASDDESPSKQKLQSVVPMNLSN